MTFNNIKIYNYGTITFIVLLFTCTLLGALAVCIKQLLIHYIRVEKLFTLKRLNQRIIEFSYGTTECKNRPSEIATRHLDPSRGLKQSGQNSLFCMEKLYIHVLVSPKNNYF